jgi:hypothetical protein
MTGDPCAVFGYGGKQVRDNTHSADLVAAFEAFHRAPSPAAVYNIGGGRASNCSMLEATALCEEIAGVELQWHLMDQPRIGGHRWWISDIERFRLDYPTGTSPTTCRPYCARSTITTPSCGRPLAKAVSSQPCARCVNPDPSAMWLAALSSSRLS